MAPPGARGRQAEKPRRIPDPRRYPVVLAVLLLGRPRRPARHRPRRHARPRDEHVARAAAVASAAWVGVALAFFAVLLARGRGRATRSAFLAGYLVEKSLSLDNVFVFLLVFGAFALPDSGAPPDPDLRHRARARPARPLHRRRRRGAVGVRLAELRVRRLPDLDGLEAVPPPPRPRRRARARREGAQRGCRSRPAGRRWPASRSSTSCSRSTRCRRSSRSPTTRSSSSPPTRSRCSGCGRCSSSSPTSSTASTTSRRRSRRC